MTRRVGILQDTTRPRTPAVTEFLALLEAPTSEIPLPEFTRWIAKDPT